MNSSQINEIFEIVIPVINRWNNRFHYQAEFLDQNKAPLYQLVTVGGVAYNAHMPPEQKTETRDLDLKLVYNQKIKPNYFYSTFVRQFNPLRTRIMLEIKKQVNLYLNQNKEVTNGLNSFDTDEYVSVGIAYKYPYLIYSNQDARDCAKLYPNMVHMVYSLLYHPKGESTTKSLVDLSMFININNPDYLYGKTLEVKLFDEYYQLKQKTKGTHLVPFVNIGQGLPGAGVGFILSDLYWLTHLHHREDRKIAFSNKLENLLTHLENLDQRPDVTSLVKQIKEAVKLNPDELANQLLDYLHQLTELQQQKRIPITLYFTLH